MGRLIKLSNVILIMIISLSWNAWAGEVGTLTTFVGGTPAKASEVNGNFNAVKAAVDDNDAAITSNYNEITKNASDIDALGAQAGVAWTEGGGGDMIGTSSAAIYSLRLNAPAAGYAIVTACGSVAWSIASSAQGLVRLKVSKTSGDTTEGDGVQFIRFQSGIGTGTHEFPFSTTRVLSVSKGVNTFYFNGLHQVVNGSARIDDHTFSAIYVPNNYNSSIIIKPIPIINP